MKQVCLILALGCLFILYGESAHSQDVMFRSDTLLSYTFQSETDSLFERIDYREEYDSANIQIDATWVRTLPVGAWERGTRFWQELYENGKTRVFNLSEWDVEMLEWIEIDRSEYFKDAHGNDTLIVSSYRDENDDWVDSRRRMVNSYNASSHLIEKLVYKGLPGMDSLYEKCEYTCDTDGNPIQEIKYGRNENEWTENYKYERSFDGTGNMLEEITYSWSVDVWQEALRYRYEYDGIGNTTFKEVDIRDDEGESWVLYTREEFSFDSQNRELVWLARMNGGPGNPDWVFRVDYYYNPAGRIARNVWADWVESEEAFVVTQKDFTHEGSFALTRYDSICAGGSYLWEGQQIESAGTYREEFVSVMGTDSIRTLCLSLFDCTGVENALPLDGILLYPVPVRDFLFIQSDLDCLEISVTDLMGREVVATTGTSVDISLLERGIYLVRLFDLDGTLLGTRKILKQ